MTKFAMLSMLVILLASMILASPPLITKSFAEELKAQVTWEVADYEANTFNQWTLEEAKSMLGHGFSKELFIRMFSSGEGLIRESMLPTEYDFRKQFPQCNNPVRDQGKCGSCWAMASVESLGDRFCQHGKGKAILSVQEIVSCCHKAKGCGGGYLDHAFDYFEESGVVSEQCIPYESQNGREPQCIHKCKDESTPYTKHKCKPGTSRYLSYDVEKLKTELLNNGPIAATFVVYKDFFYYKTGVYYHKTGEFVGLHAVEAVGWGKEGDMQYWIIANSWGADWGEGGYFRIKIDDCGINKGMISCTPLI